tara:strand:+ start:6318 stop:6767 length:450 start_codon:yes stop_codon:yes gene_type:complete
MKLSKNFSLDELTKSQTALRLGIDNTPHEEATHNLQEICENILEPVRYEFEIPFSPSSGFRCLELNRAIGSSDNSQHVSGEAVDFEVPRFSNMEVAEWIIKNLHYDQLILEFYKEGVPDSGWIHCSYVTNKENRQQAKKFDGKNWMSLQ